MPDHLTDTHPKIAQMQLELIRQMPPTERLRRGAHLTRMAREAVMSELRTHYPNVSDGELRWRLVERLYGAEFAQKVYGPVDDYQK